MAGRTDRWIVTELTARHRLPCNGQVIAQLHEHYLQHLAVELRADVEGKRVLPGVGRLLDVLADRSDVRLGLLTGNLEAGARAKLEYFNLWRYFSCGAFGDHEPERRRLFEVALARAHDSYGRRFDATDVVVVGDTPFDVDVARSGGARGVAVATGRYDVATLAQSGAHATLPSFDDLEGALAALGL